jgi:hypothetical protein
MDYTSAGFLLASIFGPLMAIKGLWCLLNSDKLSKTISSIKNSPGLLYYCSSSNLFFGLVILNLFQLWAWDLLVLVTLLGWVLTIRGILGFFAPQMLFHFAERSGYLKCHGCIPLVWGLLLCWAAYFM